MTDEELATVRERTEKATPGPWRTAEVTYPRARLVVVRSPGADGEHVDAIPAGAADTIFIAHAREDIPALLAEVERLRAEMASLEPTPELARDWRTLPVETWPRTLLLAEVARLRARNGKLATTLADLINQCEVLLNNYTNYRGDDETVNAAIAVLDEGTRT